MTDLIKLPVPAAMTPTPEPRSNSMKPRKHPDNCRCPICGGNMVFK